MKQNFNNKIVTFQRKFSSSTNGVYRNKHKLFVFYKYLNLNRKGPVFVILKIYYNINSFIKNNNRNTYTTL